MAFSFVEKPEKRKFHYKPQFYTPEEQKTEYAEDRNKDKFAERLHANWSARRRSKKERAKMSYLTIIWLAFLVFILVFFFVKFFA